MMSPRGGVPERSNGAVLKTVRPERGSWVRIPPPPLTLAQRTAVSVRKAAAVPDGVIDLLRARYPVDVLETVESGVLTIGSHGDIPTDYVQDGEYLGIHGEIRRRIAEILGLAVKPVAIVWPSILPSLEAGKIDVPGVGTGWTPERARIFRFTQPFQYFFYGVAQEGEILKCDLASLNGRKVAAEDKSFNNQELAAFLGEANLTLRATLDEIMHDLFEGRIDVAVYDFPVIKDALARRPEGSRFTMGHFRFGPKYPLTTGRFPCYVVFRSDAINLQAAAELALDALKISGELEAIYARYGFAEERLLSIMPP